MDIRDIAQTPDGYLWLASPNGLARFDGVQFTAISDSELKPNSSTALLTTKDGALWAAIGEGGLARLQGNRFQIVLPPQPTSDNVILSLAEDKGGGIWAGFFLDNTAARWTREGITWFHPSTGSGTYLALYSAPNGVLWFTTYEDCGFFDGKKFRSFPMTEREGVHMGVARQGGVWAVRGNQLLHLWENGTCEIVAHLPWVGDAPQVTVLHEDLTGNLWIGTLGVGLLRFRDGNFERVPTSFPWIQSLYEDRDGNLWVGTHGGGLNRLSPRHFFLRAAKVNPSAGSLGPRNDLVTSLATDHEGHLWMAQGYALVRATDPTNRAFAPPPGWTGPNDILTLSIGSTDQVWIGRVQPELLCWKNGQSLVEIPLPASLASFLIGPQDEVWAATKKPRSDVYEWRSKAFIPLSSKNSNLVDPICLARDTQNRLWVGTANGRVFYRRGESFIEAPMPDPKPGDMVTFLVPDGPDTIWIGCRQSGLHRWHAGRIESLPPNSGFPATELKVLEIEPKGNFWFGTSRGLIRIARNALETAMDGSKRGPLQVISYGRNDGLSGRLGFHYGFLHSSTRTPDGHLWFGTTLGALEITSENSPVEVVEPRSVLIEDLLIGDKPFPLPKTGKSIVLPPQPSPIQFRYTLPQLSTPEQIRFRYRLLGSRDVSWYSAGTLRSATFTSLSPGNYTFEVAATDPASLQQPRTASLAFTVRAAWWETFSFRLSCALAGAIAIAALVHTTLKRRMQARLRRLEQEHALERERTRIARDMHDELGASLTNIILMSEAAADEHPIDDLDQIAEAARTVSATLDQIVWTTNPCNDTLDRLVSYIAEFTEEYLAPAKIELHLELPAEIPDHPISAEKRHEIVLVVKEALNNIVKHASAHHIHIRIAFKQHELLVAIQDDGKGFLPNAVAPASNGLANMQHRMESIGGEIKIESQINRGTTVRFSVRF